MLTEAGSFPIDRRRALMPLLSFCNCNERNSYRGAVADRMICAGFDNGGVDSCQGDCGGPLTSGDGFGTLTGAISWGGGCAHRNKFGVYAGVSNASIRSFIVSNARL